MIFFCWGGGGGELIPEFRLGCPHEWRSCRRGCWVPAPSSRTLPGVLRRCSRGNHMKGTTKSGFSKGPLLYWTIVHFRNCKAITPDLEAWLESTLPLYARVRVLDRTFLSVDHHNFERDRGNALSFSEGVDTPIWRDKLLHYCTYCELHTSNPLPTKNTSLRR